MIRLFVVVEGRTEELFVKRLLQQPLLERDVDARPIIVTTSRDSLTGRKRKGGGDWTKWQADIRRTLGPPTDPNVRLTTMFDLYGLPQNFPGLDAAMGERDTLRRIDVLELMMAEAIGDRRFRAYLQRHEFEALVLAGLPELREYLDPADRPGIDRLISSIQGHAPEDIDDGPKTAPSKRLEEHIVGYVKDEHGPLAVEAAGLDKVRALCPRFHQWLTGLEGLPQSW